MAVRVVALLIPLAITMPQLRMSRPEAPAVQSVAVVATADEEAAWSRESQRGSDAAVAPVAQQPSAQEAVRTMQISPAATADSATAASVLQQVRKAPPQRVAPKLARTAQPKAALPPSRSSRPATRLADRLPANAACLPSVHCAPVVVAKFNPVVRRPL